MGNPIVVSIAMQGGAAPIIESAYTAKAGDNLLLSTANGSWTLRTPVLPAPRVWFRIFDGWNTWGDNPLTIDAGELTIDPGDGTPLNRITADVPAELVFIFLNGVWRLRDARPLFPLLFTPDPNATTATLGRLLGCPTMTFP